VPFAQLSAAEKIQLALHGNRDERGAILRDKNRMLHSYVLRNPHIEMDELVAIARNAQSGPELLEMIAGNRDWIQRADLALALVRNPKTPQAAGLRALNSVSPADLRQLAKGNGAPHIVQAARKKVIS
jgi:hypothetical protein